MKPDLSFRKVESSSGQRFDHSSYTERGIPNLKMCAFLYIFLNLPQKTVPCRSFYQ